MSRQWSETFRALGSAVLSLLKSELEAFEQDVARSGKHAAIGIGLFVAAGAFGFWTLGVATYFLIQLLAVWLPLWGASLVVTLLFAAVAGVLAMVGAKRLERFDNPIGTARRRLDDHIDWWQTRVLVAGEPAEPAEPAAQPGRSARRSAPARGTGDDSGGSDR